MRVTMESARKRPVAWPLLFSVRGALSDLYYSTPPGGVRVRGWVRVGCGSGRGGWGLWLWVQHTWFSVFYRNKDLDAACCEVTARLRVLLAERV